VIAGDGPQRSALERRAGDAPVRFVGHVEEHELAELRAGAALALAPSRSAETFGLAAAEAMAAGLPVVASRVGALPELVDPDSLVAPGDARALAEAIGRFAGDRAAGARAHERVRALCAPEVLAPALAEVYGGTLGRREHGATSA
jgi:alpha-1,6-mannosyltransferase